MIHINLYFRKLLKNTTFSIVTIAGFALSLAIVLLISNYIIYEYSYDTGFHKISRIYKLARNDTNSDAFQISINEKLKDYLDSEVYDVEKSCRFINLNYKISIVHNEQRFDGIGILQTEKSFFDIFNTKFIYGSKDKALAQPGSVILTQSYSEKIFGNTNPVGEIISL